jgi:hypothetical protein
MRIVMMMEGKTEKALFPVLRKHLENTLAGRMPKLFSRTYNARIPKGEKLRKQVENFLNDRKLVPDAVIALTDVYTGTQPPDFADAEDAKRKMGQWVGDEKRFYPHAAQYEFEAWLIPYWDRIQSLAGGNAHKPGANPESINHGNPPSRLLTETFKKGSKNRAYEKGNQTAASILRDADLSIAIEACGELKALVRTISALCVASKQ